MLSICTSSLPKLPLMPFSLASNFTAQLKLVLSKISSLLNRMSSQFSYPTTHGHLTISPLSFVTTFSWFSSISITPSQPWLVWLSGLSTSLRTKGSLVPFPIRAHAWVVGRRERGNRYLSMYLSITLSQTPLLAPHPLLDPLSPLPFQVCAHSTGHHN